LRKFGLLINVHSGFEHESSVLVVSFGRCKLQLSQSSVGEMLQAVFGGHASAFEVSLLNDRVFSFVVASKFVGFQVYKLHSFYCDQFKLFFHLWGNGDPDWIRESQAFFQEEENAWTSVTARHSRSYVEEVRANPLTGANTVKVGPRKLVFNRLTFQEFLLLQYWILQLVWCLRHYSLAPQRRTQIVNHHKRRTRRLKFQK
jgi:hypothetical protein